MDRTWIIKKKFDFNLSYDEVHYQNVIHRPPTTPNRYSLGNSYRIFRSPGQSQVEMNFTLRKSEVESLKHVNLRLNHCSASTAGAINILYNDINLCDYHLSPKWSFRRETFQLDKGFKVGKNTIKVVLHEQCRGTYWVSDAVISLSLRCPKSLKD